MRVTILRLHGISFSSLMSWGRIRESGCLAFPWFLDVIGESEKIRRGESWGFPSWVIMVADGC